jgi:hypothetical protein
MTRSAEVGHVKVLRGKHFVLGQIGQFRSSTCRLILRKLSYPLIVAYGIAEMCSERLEINHHVRPGLLCNQNPEYDLLLGMILDENESEFVPGRSIYECIPSGRNPCLVLLVFSLQL